jgi:hypothetical protein
MSATTTIVLLLIVGTQPVQRVAEFSSYQRCTEFAQGWAESQRNLHPDSALSWECLPDDRR